jgi:7-cyano-7-deazaguanine synthase
MCSRRSTRCAERLLAAHEVPGAASSPDGDLPPRWLLFLLRNIPNLKLAFATGFLSAGVPQPKSRQRETQTLKTQCRKVAKVRSQTMSLTAEASHPPRGASSTAGFPDRAILCVSATLRPGIENLRGARRNETLVVQRHGPLRWKCARTSAVAPAMINYNSSVGHKNCPMRNVPQRSGAFMENAKSQSDSDDLTVGLLLSGGLDSSILLHQLAGSGRQVQPFYTEFGLFWERDELRALRKYMSATASPEIRPLVVLQLPLADVYNEHWSITGRNVPAFDSPDQAVFLPGRNALLAIKAAFWCQMHRVRELALATLKSNPFPDATTKFFREYEAVLKMALSTDLRLLRPFEQLEKRQVMELGRDLPLELTFSCIAPTRGRHCGVCNKCRERQKAFRLVDRIDRTEYAHRLPTEKIELSHR